MKAAAALGVDAWGDAALCGACCCSGCCVCLYSRVQVLCVWTTLSKGAVDVMNNWPSRGKDIDTRTDMQLLQSKGS